MEEEKTEKQQAVEEMGEKLRKMVEDKDAKCKAAKEQLVSMLEVTADKYRTATGVAEALRVLRFVHGENGATIEDAMSLAKAMAEEATAMAKKAKAVPYEKMEILCDGFYDKDFVSSEEPMLAFEMMRIDLCRNVGGAAEDMVSFCKRVQEEIDETVRALDELQSEE